MSSRRLVISTAICIAAIYGAYYEQAGYDPTAESAKAASVYENMARGDAAEAYRRCKEASPDEPCSRTHSETLQRARSYYGQHGGAYNVVNDTQTRNLYVFVAAVSAFVAFSQFRRGRHSGSYADSAAGTRATAPAKPLLIVTRRGGDVTKWLSYLVWLMVWIILWSFLIVPVSKDFGGAIQGVILFSAWILLYYGFRFINKNVHTPATSRRSALGYYDAVVDESGLDAAVPLEVAARDYASRAGSAPQRDADASKLRTLPVGAVAEVPTSPGYSQNSPSLAPPNGVMKSAGNPLVRRAFAQAMKEVETKTYDTGLWAMALVECNGDEKSARIAYMKVRAQDIAWADAKAVESAQQTKKIM